MIYNAKDMRIAFMRGWESHDDGRDHPQAWDIANKLWPNEEPKRWVCKGCGEEFSEPWQTLFYISLSGFTMHTKNDGESGCGPVEEQP